MATEEVIKSYIGVGRVLVRPYGTTGAFRHVGNVSRLNLAHEVDVQRQRDFTRLGGGTAVRAERLNQINAAMTWLTFSAENWAIAVAGTSTAVVAGSVTDEVIKGYKGGNVRLAHPPLAISSVQTTGGSPQTKAAGADYEKTASGLFFPTTSTIVDGADLNVDYTYDDYSRLEAAMGTSTVLQILFEGLNEADSGKPTLIDLWRVAVPSAEEIALIGEELGELGFEAELLKDSTKGAGVSAYYRALIVG